MPPKQEITKEKILSVALQIVRDEGIEAVTARSVSQRIKCSTQPIYSAFTSMDELKNSVYGKALEFAQSQISKYQNEKYIPQLCLGIGYLTLAKEEKQLFRSVFLSQYSASHTKTNKLIGEEILAAHVPNSTRLRNTDMETLKRLFTKMSVYITGLGAMVNTGAIEVTTEQAAGMIEDIYETLLAGEHVDNRNAITIGLSSLGKIIGSGANADVYEYGNDKVIKLFRTKGQSGSRDEEYLKHMCAQQTGLPVPQLFETVEINGLPGLVFEKITGKTIAERMNGPAGTDDTLLLARLLHQIHTVPLHNQDGSHLHRVKDDLHWQIEHGEGLTEEERKAVNEILMALPDGNCLCHGDLHPLNVILRDNKPIIIDWQGACIGHPAYDVMRLVLMFKYAVVSGELFTEEFKTSFNLYRDDLCNLFLGEYVRLSGLSSKHIDRWLVPVAAARLSNGLCQEEKEILLKVIRENLPTPLQTQ